ncbi:MAG: formyltetrahydrofolate deformylase [Gammaproteobacteria bacterium]|nr:formyltetrahydrofolate deformylase [Gammaproteobacteria bacterium]
MRNFTLILTCPDKPGIVHDVTGAIVAVAGNIVESAQYGDTETGRFSMRINFEVSDDSIAIDDLRKRFAGVASRYDMHWSLSDDSVPPRVLILTSRHLHCLVDLLYRVDSGELRIEVPAVVSNHRDAYQLVASHNIPFHHLPVTRDTKREQEAALAEIIERERIDFVVLARYMQILSAEFCDRFAGRVINIHHSFLPGFKGAKPYHQAHSRGVKLIGATAHYVTSDLDEGPIIEQDVARVTHAQTTGQLVEAGREVEQRVLAKAVKYQSENRVIQIGAKTVVFA